MTQYAPKSFEWQYFLGLLQRLQSLQGLAIVFFGSTFTIAFSSVTGLAVATLTVGVCATLELVSELVTGGFGFTGGDDGSDFTA